MAAVCQSAKLNSDGLKETRQLTGLMLNGTTVTWHEALRFLCWAHLGRHSFWSSFHFERQRSLIFTYSSCTTPTAGELGRAGHPTEGFCEESGAFP
ncbi:hypothetical protein PM082_020298 [Marasmius tenuissimus]|nr:hypothetical protein PM082_020298 [Marasmius tenuissimus]